MCETPPNHAGGDWVLEAIAGPAAKLGIVLLEVERAVRELDDAACLARKTQEIVIDQGTRELLMQSADGRTPTAPKSERSRSNATNDGKEIP